MTTQVLSIDPCVASLVFDNSKADRLIYQSGPSDKRTIGDFARR